MWWNFAHHLFSFERTRAFKDAVGFNAFTFHIEYFLLIITYGTYLIRLTMFHLTMRCDANALGTLN